LNAVNTRVVIMSGRRELHERLAGLGAGIGLGGALVLAGLRLANTPAPQLGVEWAGVFVFGLIYLAPFGLALLALRHSWAPARPAIWLAAALLAVPAAFTAFSGVSLIFLLPAALLWPAALIALARQPPRRWLKSAGWGIVLAILVASAWLVLLTGPEEGRCWQQVLHADGQLVWQAAPYGQSMVGGLEGGGQVIRSTCTSDVITPMEVLLGLLPLMAAVVLARLAARRPVGDSTDEKEAAA
jgi:hypothetical protein